MRNLLIMVIALFVFPASPALAQESESENTLGRSVPEGSCNCRHDWGTDLMYCRPPEYPVCLGINCSSPPCNPDFCKFFSYVIEPEESSLAENQDFDDWGIFDQSAIEPGMALVSAEGPSGLDRWDRDRGEKEIEIDKPGDYSHNKGSAGVSNFRLREGETHTIRMRPGDTLRRSRPTLKEPREPAGLSRH